MPLPMSSYVPAITNPLNIYRSLLATKRIEPDPSQHRLAIHLQKLYFRLIDYSPHLEYSQRLKDLSRLVKNPTQNDENTHVAALGHPLRQNPLFARLFSRKVRRESLALTRVLTSYESAISLSSPQGLLVHGEVGSGKSMLVDILADGLPNEKKKKWHFNTFMLETLAQLEDYRRMRQESSLEDNVSEYPLLWLAKELIEKSPIIFLDEFQLPDKAASKILSQLMTVFFQLGGVLIATSNRMPEELSKASGLDFTKLPKRSMVRSTIGFEREHAFDTSPSNNEYAGFVEVLKARCEIWNMEGECDWRRRDYKETKPRAATDDLPKRPTSDPEKIYKNAANANLTNDGPGDNCSSLPEMYFVKSVENDTAWDFVTKSVLSSNPTNPSKWIPKKLLVYAREVIVPRHSGKVTYWYFSELCQGFLGPADYITLASNFHTFILDEVPIMTLIQKNEARRLITLLDALYEARCKLILRAEAGPDDIFFPEISTPALKSSEHGENDMGDAVYLETISEIYQDKTAPFRPNISAYTDNPESSIELTENAESSQRIETGHLIKHQVDFGRVSAFTGEDERFIYKRARSRLWEMCGSRWHARSDPNWWRPLPAEVRRWERSNSLGTIQTDVQFTGSDVMIGDFIELDKPAGLQGLKNGEDMSTTESSYKRNCKK
ncbi:unnamed protein product [Blumeria hordei]|uniref:AAA+ ATPase domain-containing protein n=2 Tax=Blumeria hordei TaxID=2867405 RepID=A0A383UVG5_BLUHO|nr:ATPase [Blumeria hordei DH14]SZF03272.1 unnamed protein product [Blumeria hordei]